MEEQKEPCSPIFSPEIQHSTNSPILSPLSQSKLLLPPFVFDAKPAVCKVLIPGRFPDEKPIWVNSLQARRILVQRQKRYKRWLLMMDLGLKVDPKLTGARNTLGRKKDPIRSRVASERKRVSGLFVNKRKEM